MLTLFFRVDGSFIGGMIAQPTPLRSSSETGEVPPDRSLITPVLSQNIATPYEERDQQPHSFFLTHVPPEFNPDVWNS